MRHLNILIIYFIYFKFSLTIVKEVTNYYNGLSFCKEQFFDSINYICIPCNGIKIDGICYSYNSNEQTINNIYGELSYGVLNDSQTKTAFDFKGNLLGRIMNATTDIDINLDELSQNYQHAYPSNPNANGNTYYSFPLSFGNTQETITITEFKDSKFYYYYHACVKGLFIEYCQFLANICTLSIYNTNCYACKAIEDLNGLIVERLNKDKDVFGGSYPDYKHFLKFNESLTDLKKKKIEGVQTSLDSEDNSNINQLNLYLAK